MNPDSIPEFLREPTFWFALINAVVIFLPRFGITLNAQEIAALNLVVATAFKLTPPINSYVAVKRYELAARSSPVPYGAREVKV